MPSFDAVIEPDLVELKNAVEQANKEMWTPVEPDRTPNCMK